MPPHYILLRQLSCPSASRLRIFSAFSRLPSALHSAPGYNLSSIQNGVYSSPYGAAMPGNIHRLPVPHYWDCGCPGNNGSQPRTLSENTLTSHEEAPDGKALCENTLSSPVFCVLLSLQNVRLSFLTFSFPLPIKTFTVLAGTVSILSPVYTGSSPS